MADYLTTDTELTSVANAIRTKGGTSAALVYPAGFVSAIEAIPTGGSNIKHSIFEWDDNYGCFVYSSGDIITRNEFAFTGCSAVGMAIDEYYNYYYIAYFDGDPLVCVSDLNNQSVTAYDEDYSEDNNGMFLSEAGLPFTNGVIHIFVY